jgi:hypothetical protein
MAALIAATGLALDTIQVTGINTRWWALIAFLVFCGLVTWIIVDIRNRNKELENEKPAISVVPEHFQAFSWYLRITNDGEKADFSATVTFVHPTGTGEEYNAIWLETMTDKIELKNGDKGMLQIALIKASNAQEYFVMNGYDTAKKLPKVIRRIEYGQFLKQPNMTVQVVIKAYPKFKGGKPFIKTYTIGSQFLIESKHQPKRLDGFPSNAIFPEDDFDIKN